MKTISRETFPKNVECVTIPRSVISIEPEAFKNYKNLREVKFEEGSELEYIGNNAFEGCISLESITIPRNVKELGKFRDNEDYHGKTFANCANLKEVKFEEGSQLECIASYIFENCTNLIDIQLPSSVIRIGMYAFRNCANLTNFIMPDSVTTVARFIFCGCTNLKNVSLSENLNKIEEGMFSKCINLTNVMIPIDIETIDYEAFYGCVGLKSITIPNKVKNIKDRAFYGCVGLKSITIPYSVEIIGEHAFEKTKKLKVYVYNKDLLSPKSKYFGFFSGAKIIQIKD